MVWRKFTLLRKFHNWKFLFGKIIFSPGMTIATLPSVSGYYFRIGMMKYRPLMNLPQIYGNLWFSILCARK